MSFLLCRLCTDEPAIVRYWNNIDTELELEMDVIDDLCGEAAEIHENNPWLTYGEQKFVRGVLCYHRSNGSGHSGSKHCLYLKIVLVILLLYFVYVCVSALAE